MVQIHFRFALTVSLIFLAQAAGADEVQLRNGDRLSGKVLSKSGEILRLETAYAGVIKIRWAEVSVLETQAPVALMKAGAPWPVNTRLEAQAGERLRLVKDGSSLPLGEVAYINPKPEESGLGTAYGGHVNFSASTVRGNNTSERVYADADFVGRAKLYRYGLSGKITRSSDAGRSTASNWLGQANYDRFLDQDRFLYARTSLQHDRFKDLDLRASLGAGYGKDLIETERVKVTLRAGLDQVTIDHAAAAHESFQALGWGLHATYKFHDGGPVAFHDQDGYWNLRQRDRVAMRSRTGLRIPVFEKLSATAQLNLDWDRSPASKSKPTDATLLLGVTYAW